MATAKRKKLASSEVVQIAPGYVVINVSKAAGGVTYDREVIDEEIEGDRIVSDYQTRKTVDNAALVKAIDQTVKEVDHALRILCTRTAFGYFVSPEKVDIVRAKVAGIAVQVEELNVAAEKAGSAHRGRVGIVTAYLDIGNPDNLRECYRVIRETLREIYDALRAGDVRDVKDTDGDIVRRHQLRPILIRARNLEQMALGVHGHAIKTALDRAKTAKTEILAALAEADKNGEELSPEAAGAQVDLSQIETAIHWFEEDV